MKSIRNIAILGSTGSIGRQTLEIVDEYPQLFRPWLLVANNSVQLLVEQALKYRPQVVVIGNEEHYRKVKEALAQTSITVLAGSRAIAQAVVAPEIDTVVTAMVGYSGLEPTIEAIKAGKKIALANKETRVVAGDLITRLVAQNKQAMLYPVDSEHGAFWQCLVGEKRTHVSKLILTASGGPFRTWSQEDLAKATVQDALAHPNWNMGNKITIDSATMMNKGFEMIEAKWLYGIEPCNIEIVVHPQSIVHSMVEFVDGSIKAQLGLPDMRLPIRYALGLPDRLPSNSRKMTVEDYCNLTFERPDFNKFPLLGVAYDAAKRGGNVPCVMNAANEIAVAHFLKGKICFNDIYKIIEQTLAWAPYIATPSHADYVASNEEARLYASTLI